MMMECGVGRLPDQFLGGEAEHPAGGGIHERDSPLGVRAEDALGAGFEDEPCALFSLLAFFAFAREAKRIGDCLGCFFEPASLGFCQRLEQTKLENADRYVVGEQGTSGNLRRSHGAKTELHAEFFRVRRW